jgi:hypothetical protein
VGRKVTDLFHDQNRDRPHALGYPIATYDYFDLTGRLLLYQVVRFEPKDFRCRRPDGSGGWIWSIDGVPVVPYRLDGLAEARRIYIGEGEKDCDTLANLGLIATTNHGGAGKWRDAHTRALVDAAVPEVVVLRDNDRPGVAHQEAVARACATAGLRVKCVALPGLPPLQEKHGEDVSDWLSAGHSVSELEALADAAPVFVPRNGRGSPEDAQKQEPTEPTRGAEPLKVLAHGDEVRVQWADTVEFLAVAHRESGEGIQAEVTVSCQGSVLSWGRLNLASTSMREALVKRLREARRDVPWRERLEHACRLVTDQLRAGSPLVVLRPRPRVAADRDLIEHVLPAGETSLLYGDGDSGKGWLTLLMAVALDTGLGFPYLRPNRQGIRVAYLDWESTEDEIAARVDGLSRGLGLTRLPERLLYRSMSRALADEASRLRADLAREGVGFVIVDSLAPAAGAEPESADSTIRAMNALRSFTGTTRLVLAHVSKAAADQPGGATRPYGSVFVRNLARSAWELRRADDTDPDELVVAAYHRKHNAGHCAAPFSLRLKFAPDGAVTVTGANLADSPDLLARTSLTQQITIALTRGAFTNEELAAELNADKSTVARIVRRMREKGKVVQVGDGKPARWGLKAR